jgi:hypothetical protein
MDHSNGQDSIETRNTKIEMIKINSTKNLFYCTLLFFSEGTFALKPWEAEARTDAPLLSFHQTFVKQATRPDPKNINVMFYGDSITQR